MPTPARGWGTFMNDFTSKILCSLIALYTLQQKQLLQDKVAEEPRPLIFYSHLEVVTVPFPLHVPYHFSKRGVHVNAQKALTPESWMHHGNENNARNSLHLYKLLWRLKGTFIVIIS